MTLRAEKLNLSPIQWTARGTERFGQRPMTVVQGTSSYRVADFNDEPTATGQIETGCYVPREGDLGDTVARVDRQRADVDSGMKDGALAEVHAFPTSSYAAEAFRVVQRWEGTVTEIVDGEFVARLRDLTELGHPPEQATFSLDEVDEDDLALLQVGAVFYWSIKYHRQSSGARRLANELRFRRVPAWTSRELAKLNRPSELDALFGGND